MLGPLLTAVVGPSTQDTIANHKVAIFSKSYCPYCKKTKELIKSLVPEGDVEIVECVPVRIPFVAVSTWTDMHFDPDRLDERDDGSAIQDYLNEKTGQRTVPNVFISKHIFYVT